MNRTRHGYLDQTQLSGHQDRIEDLDLFATLGLTAIRYPVLWERVAPDDPAILDWTWSDRGLDRLQRLGIRPILGLVHHGSGPRYTHLLDEGFASGLRRYAGLAAERYPWVDDWTPVNEPLTTARFSALYGHWYPHRRDLPSFWLAVLNQVDGIRAAMKAIRRVNPGARLIQTDDLGRTYATRPLAEQAAFDNLRRWAGWDLLFGRVTRFHPLWEHLARLGLADRLRGIADDPCPPDVIGLNHYLTSDRFLDHRLQRYPAQSHGGNDRIRYADVEAIRVLDPVPAGFAGAIEEVWQRYKKPLAITEVHNGCTREEQLRWAADAWDTALKLKADGVDIEAVTAWALLGSDSWNTLLTSPGKYETGVFDVASGTPRSTALAQLWRGLPTGAPRHPVAMSPGWWQRRDRLMYPSLTLAKGVTSDRGEHPPKVLLICGATGTLGQAFARACVARGIRHRIVGRETIDLEQAEDVGIALDRIRPWAVVNATGWVRVDDAENAEAACHRVNADGAIALAQACATRGIGTLSFSSDLVFDGTASRPYVEADTPCPLSAYGRSKVAMEEGCANLPGALVIRSAAFFSAFDPHNFAWAVVDALANGRRFAAAHDHIVSPTFVPTLVDTSLDLLIDGSEGLWHLSSGEAISWANFAARIASACSYETTGIDPVPGNSLGWLAPRPKFVPLASMRGPLAEPFQVSIERFAHDYRLGARVWPVSREVA